MRNCKEMRQEAWHILTGSKWGWRILLNYLVLWGLLVSVGIVLGVVFHVCGIQTWNSFLAAQKAAAMEGVKPHAPSLIEVLRMTSASFFVMFIRYVFMGIMTFGIVVTLLKCVKNDTDNWFADAFGGFRRPLEMFWLVFLQGIKLFLWTLLFIVPGIIAAIRYVATWYVKAENPEMGANACIKRSCEIMYGRKKKFVVFCLSYIGWYLLAVVPFVLLMVISIARRSVGYTGVSLTVTFASIVLLFALGAFVTMYGAIGLAIFYRDAKAEADCSAEMMHEV